MKPEADALRLWYENWKQVAERQEALRIMEIRNTNTIDVLPSFDTAFRSALWLVPNAPTSGLVELQKKLAKLHK
jgi:hypothetical protein